MNMEFPGSAHPGTNKKTQDGHTRRPHRHSYQRLSKYHVTTRRSIDVIARPPHTCPPSYKLSSSFPSTGGEFHVIDSEGTTVT